MELAPRFQRKSQLAAASTRRYAKREIGMTAKRLA
jgi:hypothetical protein